MPETLTIDQAAARLGCSRRLAYDAARRGELPAIRLGRKILISRAGLDRMLAGEEIARQPIEAGA